LGQGKTDYIYNNPAVTEEGLYGGANFLRRICSYHLTQGYQIWHDNHREGKSVQEADRPHQRRWDSRGIVVLELLRCRRHALTNALRVYLCDFQLQRSTVHAYVMPTASCEVPVGAY